MARNQSESWTGLGWLPQQWIHKLRLPLDDEVEQLTCAFRVLAVQIGRLRKVAVEIEQQWLRSSLLPDEFPAAAPRSDRTVAD